MYSPATGLSMETRPESTSAAAFTPETIEKPIVEIRKLDAWYGAKQALYDISMRFAKNHVTAIIGPSGCGKSTLVRCVNRLHELVPNARAAGRMKANAQAHATLPK